MSVLAIADQLRLSRRDAPAWKRERSMYVARPEGAGTWVAFDTGRTKGGSIIRWCGGMCADSEPGYTLVLGTVCYSRTLSGLKQSLNVEIWRTKEGVKLAESMGG